MTGAWLGGYGDGDGGGGGDGSGDGGGGDGCGDGGGGDGCGDGGGGDGGGDGDGGGGGGGAGGGDGGGGDGDTRSLLQTGTLVVGNETVSSGKGFQKTKQAEDPQAMAHRMDDTTAGGSGKIWKVCPIAAEYDSHSASDSTSM